MPGRAVVARRACVEIVRDAVPGSYGVTGLAEPTLWRILRASLGFGQPGDPGGPPAGGRGRRLAHGRLRPARRGGRPPGRLRGPLRARARARPDGRPDRRSTSRAGGTAVPSRRPATRRRQVHRVEPALRPEPTPSTAADDGPGSGPPARRGPPSVTRRACDGAGLLEAVRAAVANLEAHVDEVNALNVFPVPDGDTGSNMVATCAEMLRYVRDETSVEDVADRLREGALFGARGQLGRHPQPDRARPRRGLRRQAPLQRPRPRPRLAAGQHGRVRRRAAAGRGHDADRHPRGRGGGRRDGRARERHRGGARRRHRRRRPGARHGRRACCRSSARPAWSTPAGPAWSDSSTGPSTSCAARRRPAPPGSVAGDPEPRPGRRRAPARPGTATRPST